MLKMFPRFVVFSLLLALSVAPTLAAGPYLGSGAPDAIQLLPPPPAPGSVEDIADRETTYRIYSARTPEQVALAQAQQHLNVFHLTTMIAWFQPGRFPKTEALFKQVETESYPISGRAKKIWQRARPYQAEPTRYPQVIEQDAKPSSGYPSGHATRATMLALILVELFPEHRDAILAKAQESSWLRIQGGVHTPLDIYAGRTLGQAIAQAFLRNAEFQYDLAEAKAELATAQAELATAKK
jgi:acid phosphatase (class A)